MCSAERLFRMEPVLAWTLRRLARSRSMARTAVLCWEDQQPAVGPIAAGLGGVLLGEVAEDSAAAD